MNQVRAYFLGGPLDQMTRIFPLPMPSMFRVPVMDLDKMQRGFDDDPHPLDMHFHYTVYHYEQYRAPVSGEIFHLYFCDGRDRRT